MAANTSDFLGGGGELDPFAPTAPGADPFEAERTRLLARKQQLADAANSTANINAAPGDYADSRQDPNAATGTPEESDAYMRAHHLGKYANSFAHNLVRDPVTMGILAAPAAITGLGAAIGGGAALGFGAGDAIGGAAAAGSGYGLPAGIPAAGEAFSMPAATALGSSALPAAGAAGVAGGAAGALGGVASAAGAASPWLQYGLPAGLTALGVGADIYAAEKKHDAAEELQKRQEQIQRETQERRELQSQSTFDMLGKKLLAMNPLNQAMAQMYGPDAAFAPTDFANMASNPNQPQLDPALMNYHGTDPAKQAQVEDYLRRKAQYDQAEQSRRDMIMNGVKQPGAGPAPLQPITPQAARRF